MKTRKWMWMAVSSCFRDETGLSWVIVHSVADVLSPNPLSKDGEGAFDPFPTLGEGAGDGDSLRDVAELSLNGESRKLIS
jgi:hypothetical protein